MASEADSGEQLGEKAPAGVWALEVDKQGLRARWEDVDEQPSLLEEAVSEPGVETVSPEVSVQTPPRPAIGGEPEVGSKRTMPDMSKRA